MQQSVYVLLWLKIAILIHVEASTCLTVLPSLDLSGHIAMLHNSLSSVSSVNEKKNHFLCYSFCFCAETSIMYYVLGLNIYMVNLGNLSMVTLKYNTSMFVDLYQFTTQITRCYNSILLIYSCSWSLDCWNISFYITY